MGDHKIQSLTFDISVADEQTGRAQISTIESIVKNRLIRTIEQVFDEFTGQDISLRVDELSIDLGEISLYELDAEMEFRLRQKLKSQVIVLVEEKQQALAVQRAVAAQQETQQKKAASQGQEEIKRSEFKKKTQQQVDEAMLTEEGKQKLIVQQEEAARLADMEKVKAIDWLEKFFRTGILPWWMNVGTSDFNTVQQAVSEVLRKHPESILDLLVRNFLHDQFHQRLIKYLPLAQLHIPFGLDFGALKSNIISLTTSIPEAQGLTHAIWEAVLKDPSPETVEYKTIQHVYHEVSRQQPVTLSEFVLWVRIQTHQTAQLSAEMKATLEKMYEAADFSSIQFFQPAVRLSVLLQDVRQLSESARRALLSKLFAPRPEIVTHTDAAVRLLTHVAELSATQQSQLELLVWIELIQTSVKAPLRQMSPVHIVQQALALTSNLSGHARQMILTKVMAYVTQVSRKPSAVAQGLSGITSHTYDALRKDFEEVQREVMKKESVEERHQENDSVVLGLQYILFGLTKVNESDAATLIAGLKYLIAGDRPIASRFTREEYQAQLSAFVRRLQGEEVIFAVERLQKLAMPDSQRDSLARLILAAHPEIMRAYLAVERLDEWASVLEFSLSFAIKYGRLPFQDKAASKTALVYWYQYQPADLARVMERLLPLGITRATRASGTSEIHALILGAFDQAMVPLSNQEQIEWKRKYPALTPTQASAAQDQVKEEKPKMSMVLEEEAQRALASSVFIRNAGLVLLGPYLPMLLERAGLLDEKKMLNDEQHKIKAIEWFHYLVFGTEEMEEYDALLSKILTNLPISVSLPSKISLSDSDKEMCNGLLQAVVSNWTVNKSSSVANLRGSFLIREGKLTNEEAQYTLVVEEKGYDMLLDKVPWSFRLIKYKWMDKAVFVDWR
ncbi:contractile injection system tape measure protein [Reichenbachiella carrageenanivorans]|uniref:Contractile injection system tape measure protein n=1 Tax=Reichenbachiella carrageenanivorans TaxID=2979869 RepID=A0ABY6CUZ1_9BACT|nr:contractile injection system tape measure protein [Reichenbachiella carrageenanivorans]UXX77741.1 contractile injection system tape measure protein [Reichenbachiella carrageenanivorans]